MWLRYLFGEFNELLFLGEVEHIARFREHDALICRLHATSNLFSIMNHILITHTQNGIECCSNICLTVTWLFLAECRWSSCMTARERCLWTRRPCCSCPPWDTVRVRRDGVCRHWSGWALDWEVQARCETRQGDCEPTSTTSWDQ